MIEARQHQDLCRKIGDEARTPYLPKFWRDVVVRRLSLRSETKMAEQLRRRLAYLDKHLPCLTNPEWLVTTDENLKAETAVEFAKLNSLSSIDQFLPKSWFLWAIEAAKERRTGLAVYCFANHWIMPAYAEKEFVRSFDEVGFRMLRWGIVNLNGGDLSIEYTSRGEDFEQLAPSVTVRRSVEDLLNVQTGLSCLGTATKKYLERATRLLSESWHNEYLTKNLRYVKDNIEGFCRDPHGEGERQLSELVMKLRRPESWDEFFSTIQADCTDVYGFLRIAVRQINAGQYAEALYVLARLYTLPEIAAEDRTDFAIARILIGRCVRMLRHDPYLKVGYEEALEQMAGLSWIDDDRVVHEAVCPKCAQGDRFGSGDYSVDLRAYFEGEPEQSIDRPLVRLMVNCGGGCTSTVFISSGECSEDWSSKEVRAYLLGLGSPLADHLTGVDLSQIRELGDED